MTVAETTTIDQVAAHDGRLLLAMTEVRPYVSGDTAALVEDFGLKMNAYVHAIRSGRLRPDGCPPPPGTTSCCSVPMSHPARCRT